jgi:hypothetical protein
MTTTKINPSREAAPSPDCRKYKPQDCRISKPEDCRKKAFDRRPAQIEKARAELLAAYPGFSDANGIVSQSVPLV